MSQLRVAAAVLALVVVLAGCRTTVETAVLVESATDATLQIAVMMEGDAASALTQDGRLEQLRELIEQRTGTAAQVSRRQGTVTVSAAVTYDRLVGSSGLTGVTALRLDPVPENGQTTVTVDVAAPQLLEQVLADTVAQRDDPEPFLAAVRGSTWVQVVIDMPRGVDHAEILAGDLPVDVTHEQVRVVQPLSEFGDGRFTVTGTPGGQQWWRNTGTLIVGVLAAVGGLVAVAAARRRAP